MSAYSELVDFVIGLAERVAQAEADAKCGPYEVPRAALVGLEVDALRRQARHLIDAACDEAYGEAG